jgi:hypothetical protein
MFCVNKLAFSVPQALCRRATARNVQSFSVQLSRTNWRFVADSTCFGRKAALRPVANYHCRDFRSAACINSQDGGIAGAKVNLVDEYDKLNFSAFDDYLFQVFSWYMFV